MNASALFSTKARKIEREKGREGLQTGGPYSLSSGFLAFVLKERLGIAAALVVMLSAVGSAWAEDAFYNITSVEAKQMSNAVQIVFKADGVISPDMDRLESEFTDWRRLQSNGWRFDLETTKPMEYVTIHFYNARLQVNSLVPVGKYPVSHVAFTPTGSANSPQVDMALFLYTGSLISRVKSQHWDDTCVPGTDWGNNVRMEIVLGEDKRSVLITVISDRSPDAPERRTVEGLKDSDTELSVGYDGDRFDIHAKSARLSDLVRKMQSVSGRPVKLDPLVERLVNAELPSISFDNLVARLCQCYGLTTANSPEGEIVIRDAVAASGGAYTRQETQILPLKWLSPDKALGLLPNFLVSCVRVDKDNNQLVVSGSPELAEKIRSDLAFIDQPTKTVMVEASLVEVSTSVDVDTVLALGYRNAKLGADLEIPSVRFDIGKSEVSPAEFTARLKALLGSGAARSVSTARLSALSGEQGTLFAGLDKYIQVRDPNYDKDNLVPIKAGMTVTIKPLVKGGQVQVTLTAEVSNISMVDPITNRPVVDTRKATGCFRISSGECIVVGGMDQLQSNIERRRLFIGNVKQNQQSRLLLLLTPRIVEDAVDIRSR